MCLARACLPIAKQSHVHASNKCWQMWGYGFGVDIVLLCLRLKDVVEGEVFELFPVCFGVAVLEDHTLILSNKAGLFVFIPFAFCKRSYSQKDVGAEHSVIVVKMTVLNLWNVVITILYVRFEFIGQCLCWISFRWSFTARLAGSRPSVRSSTIHTGTCVS
eukprot:TRINITY_DN11068_c0_g1_i6.p4 TRINITY_DN11068_c0_g1~~TRINITY_DN11068_c0_g1_i6.p4  ORF type:complete len:161 (-),score=5.70 TRINITY_DN11068_c0_g1_i6:1440-1922(-)